MSSSCLNAIYSILLAILFFFVESEHYNCIFIIVKMYLVYYFEKIYRKRKVWALTLTNCWLWVWSKHVLERNWCFFSSGHVTWASENFLDIVPNCLSPLYDSEHNQTQKWAWNFFKLWWSPSCSSRWVSSMESVQAKDQ